MFEKSNSMEDLTAIVISFLRPRYTIDCIRSLKETYPNIGEILVGENGKYNNDIAKVVSEVNGRYIDLDFDSGVPAGRNRLIEKVKTKYILVGDDDFLYDKDAMVDKMVGFLESKKEFDLIGGRILEDDRIKNYQGYFEIYDDHIVSKMTHENTVSKRDSKSGLRYKEVDLTFNYFVARKKRIIDVPWDENIKVAYEHSHFFIRLKKAGKRVAFSPDPIVKHKFQKYSIDKEYNMYRNRKSDKHYFFKSLGITWTKGMSGHVHKIEPKGDQKYYALRGVKIKGKRYSSGDIVTISDSDYKKLPKGIKNKIRKS